MEKRKSLVGTACAVSCQFIFGFSLLFTKTATDTVSPMTLLSWRFIIAFIVFNICILLRIIKVNLRGKRLISLFAIALFYPILYFVFETIGINFTSASEAGTIIAVIPIATLLFSAILLKEKPEKLKIAGTVITLIGVVIIVSVRGTDAMFNPLGYSMLFLAVVSYALYAVYAQKADEFTSTEKSYVMTAMGAAAFSCAALVENWINGTLIEFLALPVSSGSFLAATLYLGIASSIGAFLLYNTAIANIGATRAVSFAGITPIIAVVAGVIVLGEQFSWLQGIGTVSVIGGVYLANIMPKEKSG